MLPDWIIAALWGFIGGIALLLGGIIGYNFKLPQRLVASIMALGAGVLIAAACFDLLEEAYSLGGFDSTVVGFFLGVVVFTVADVTLARRGGKHRKRSDKARIPEGYDENPQAIMVGALLDGIPESIAIGLTIITGGAVSAATFIAVFISNFPEGLSSTVGMKMIGWKKFSIYGLWLLIASIAAIASLAGYSIFATLPNDVTAATLALAAGAVLTMIADTMLPEAFAETHEITGLIMAVGFIVSFVLTIIA
jgi:ZIP family zinc transporter